MDPRIETGVRAQLDMQAAAVAGGASHLGWKAGFGTTAAMEKLKTNSLLVGFLTDATLLSPGVAVSMQGWDNPLLEPEVALRLGRDLPPGADRATTLAALDGVAPAIELVDLGDVSSVERILEVNIFHRHVVLGDFVAFEETLIDGLSLDVDIDWERVIDGVDPRQMTGDPVDVVRTIAEQMPTWNTTLRAGDVIITGSGAVPLQLHGGELVEMAFAGIGSVAVAVATTTT